MAVLRPVHLQQYIDRCKSAVTEEDRTNVARAFWRAMSPQSWIVPPEERGYENLPVLLPYLLEAAVNDENRKLLRDALMGNSRHSFAVFVQVLHPALVPTPSDLLRWSIWWKGILQKWSHVRNVHTDSGEQMHLFSVCLSAITPKERGNFLQDLPTGEYPGPGPTASTLRFLITWLLLAGIKPIERSIWAFYAWFKGQTPSLPPSILQEVLQMDGLRLPPITQMLERRAPSEVVFRYIPLKDLVTYISFNPEVMERIPEARMPIFQRVLAGMDPLPDHAALLIPREWAYISMMMAEMCRLATEAERLFDHLDKLYNDGTRDGSHLTMEDTFDDPYNSTSPREFGYVSDWSDYDRLDTSGPEREEWEARYDTDDLKEAFYLRDQFYEHRPSRRLERVQTRARRCVGTNGWYQRLVAICQGWQSLYGALQLLEDGPFKSAHMMLDFWDMEAEMKEYLPSWCTPLIQKEDVQERLKSNRKLMGHEDACGGTNETRIFTATCRPNTIEFFHNEAILNTMRVLERTRSLAVRVSKLYTRDYLITDDDPGLDKREVQTRMEMEETMQAMVRLATQDRIKAWHTRLHKQRRDRLQSAVAKDKPVRKKDEPVRKKTRT